MLLLRGLYPMKIASIWNPFKPQWAPIVQALPFVCTTGLGMSTTPHIFRPNWAFLIAGVVSEVSSRSASSFVTQRTGSDAIHPTDRTCDISWLEKFGSCWSACQSGCLPRSASSVAGLYFDHVWSFLICGICGPFPVMKISKLTQFKPQGISEILIARKQCPTISRDCGDSLCGRAFPVEASMSAQVKTPTTSALSAH